MKKKIIAAMLGLMIAAAANSCVNKDTMKSNGYQDCNKQQTSCYEN